MLLLFLLLLTPSLAKNESHPLDCAVDVSMLGAMIADIEALGYTAQKAMFSNQLDDLAANTGGGYSNYMRFNHSIPYKMGALSAVLYHGCTPPKAAYYGYSTTLYMDNNTLLWAGLGDVLNHRVIQTYNESGAEGFDDMTTIITTANLPTYNDILSVYLDYNFTQSMINLDPIPFKWVTRMGTNNISSSFHTFLRVSLPHDYDAFTYYFAHLNSSQLANLYFITKGESNEEINQFVPDDPLPTPITRDRHCPHNGSEYVLESALNQLVNHTAWGMTTYRRYIRNTTQIFGTEYDGYECITNRQFCGPGHGFENETTSADVLYYEAYETMESGHVSGYLLTDDNLFMVIGINHYNLGLTTHNQYTVTKVDKESFSSLHNPYATLNNIQYNNSANYLAQMAFGSENDTSFDFSYFYAIMYVRPGLCVEELVEQGVLCVEIGYHELEKNEEMAFFGRAYLNPCTNTGPSKDQFMYESLLMFRYDPYDEELETKFGIIVIVSMAAVVACILSIFGCMYLITKRRDMLINKYYKAHDNRYDGVALTSLN
eukprot:124287_1